MIENWREDYNQQRPHSSLNCLQPAEFARTLVEMWASVNGRYRWGDSVTPRSSRDICARKGAELHKPSQFETEYSPVRQNPHRYRLGSGNASLSAKLDPCFLQSSGKWVSISS